MSTCIEKRFTYRNRICTAPDIDEPVIQKKAGYRVLNQKNAEAKELRRSREIAEKQWDCGLWFGGWDDIIQRNIKAQYSGNL